MKEIVEALVVVAEAEFWVSIQLVFLQDTLYVRHWIS